MPTTIEKICRTCKFPFSFPMAEATFPCPACGAVNGRPEVQGAAYDRLKRATRQRLGCDFHNAEVSYQRVLQEHPEDHEALWGLALCRYGVEYVQDTKTGKLMPTVHSIRKKPMQLDNDYLAACEYAPEELRAQYAAEARYVDEAMARIRKLAETQPEFDVFICHKTTRPGSEDYTEDCMRAFRMAHLLEKHGYCVFFAPETMEGVAAGSDYEAAIYHALDTAKVMLLFCSDTEYLNSPWVRSEWMRFLEMTDEREDKCLLPLLYGGFPAAKLPGEICIRRLEGVRMEELDAKDIVLRVLEKYCGKWLPEDDDGPETAPETDFALEPTEEGWAITEYLGSAEEVIIPAAVQGGYIMEIRPFAFRNAGRLRRVVLPEELAWVRGGAFWNCAALEEIAVDAKNRHLFVRDGVVYGRQGPELLCCPPKHAAGTFVVPPDVKYIGQGAFQRSLLLTGVVLPEGLKEIEENAFVNTGLTEVAIPESVKLIRAGAFGDNAALRRVTLAEGTLLEKGVFGNCPRLAPESVIRRDGETPSASPAPAQPARDRVAGTQPDPARAQPASACAPEEHFAVKAVEDGCVIAKYLGPGGHVRIPPTIGGRRVLGVGGMAFRYCRELLSVTLPAGVTDIGEEAFANCDGLTGVTLPVCLRSIGSSAFTDCKALTAVSIPGGVTRIGDYAFARCTALRSAEIPDSVGGIGKHAFWGCSRLPFGQRFRLKLLGAM